MNIIWIPISQIKDFYLGECNDQLGKRLNDIALWGKEADEYKKITPTLAGFIAYCRPFFNSEQFEIMHIPSKQIKNATKTDNI